MHILLPKQIIKTVCPPLTAMLFNYLSSRSFQNNDSTYTISDGIEILIVDLAGEKHGSYYK